MDMCVLYEGRQGISNPESAVKHQQYVWTYSTKLESQNALSDEAGVMALRRRD
jgi:hypothetical protein